jgi:hypothetical protein
MTPFFQNACAFYLCNKSQEALVLLLDVGQDAWSAARGQEHMLNSGA